MHTNSWCKCLQPLLTFLLDTPKRYVSSSLGVCLCLHLSVTYHHSQVQSFLISFTFLPWHTQELRIAVPRVRNVTYRRPQVHPLTYLSPLIFIVLGQPDLGVSSIRDRRHTVLIRKETHVPLVSEGSHFGHVSLRQSDLIVLTIFISRDLNNCLQVKGFTYFLLTASR